MKSGVETTTTALLRTLPSVEKVLNLPTIAPLLSRYRHPYLVDIIRFVLTRVRHEMLSGAMTAPLDENALLQRIKELLVRDSRSSLRTVINATGTVLHTNLGRALLAKAAIDEVVRAAVSPVALEYDLEEGGRGDRDRIVEDDLLALTGAEAVTIVNNNAAAVLIALNSIAEGKEGIVSRGELIEIGGSFRIPDVMRKSGVILREVGTTNRTHLADYTEAISSQTGVLLKVHPSNYRIVGFTSSVSLAELVALGRERQTPVVEDLGAGALIDLSVYGLPREPVVAERIAAGADIVTFSGDKLLGGPQAGIIVGRREWIDRIKRNPLKRALRPDKLTLAALSGTLSLYRRSPDLAAELPTLRWLTRPRAEMDVIAAAALPLLQSYLGSEFSVTIEDSTAQIGSGSVPEEEVPSRVIAIRRPRFAGEKIADQFRAADPPILGRVRDNAFLLDLRGIFAAEEIIPQHKGVNCE